MIRKLVDKKKGISVFALWILIGVIIFTIFAGGFVILSRQYMYDLDIESLAKQSNQLLFSDGIMTVMDSDTQLHFDLDKDIFINYITISVKDLNAAVVNVKLYYAKDVYEFDEAKVVNSILKKGLMRLEQL